MQSVFISYSHKDEAWKDRLLTHLEPLAEKLRLEIWQDRRIAGGDDWREQIAQAMQRCRLAFLLVSPDFLRSEFIRSKEVPELLQRREQEGMRVYPILLKACVWKHIGWLAPIQMRPKEAIPLASFGEPGSARADEALAAIADEVVALLESLPRETPETTGVPHWEPARVAHQSAPAHDPLSGASSGPESAGTPGRTLSALRAGAARALASGRADGTGARTVRGQRRRKCPGGARLVAAPGRAPHYGPPRRGGGQLQETLAELPANSGLPMTGREFLERMRDDSGVLVPAGPGRIGFLHQTFQEYLAARYAAEERRSADLVARLGESWWREATLLALAQGSRSFCREFFQALANSGDLSRHSEIVDQCIEEAAFFVPEPLLQRLRAPGTSEAAQIEILKRLKTRPSLAVVEACQTLVGAPGELGQLTRELLAGQGVGIEPGVDAGEARVTTDTRTGLSFVWIPPGRFRMGPDNITDDERPVHDVELTRGFWLSRYAVTNEDYQRFLEAQANVQRPEYWDNQRFNGKRQPVVGVSWNDAAAYCQWAGCRLPTEAEWEFACRAGSPNDYCFGSDPGQLKEFAWFGEDWSTGSTHPVGQKNPNGWGLYDMHGNVWEWCQDWYAGYPKQVVTDPAGAPKGSSRVLRGGSWDSPAEYCRSACRNWLGPAARGHDLGFRVVLARSSVPGQTST